MSATSPRYGRAWRDEKPVPDALRRWLLDTVAEHTGVDAARLDPDRPLATTACPPGTRRLAADLEDLVGTRLPSTLLWESPTIDPLARSLTGSDEPDCALHGRRRTDPIAVVGLGCRWPGADGLEEFWGLVSTGRDAVRTAPPGRWSADAAPVVGGFLDDVAGFDARVLRHHAARGRGDGPAAADAAGGRVGGAGTRRASPPASLRGSRTGVFVGIAGHEYGTLTMADRRRRRRVDGDRGGGEHRGQPAVLPARPARPEHDRRHRVLVLAGRGAPRGAQPARRRVRPGARRPASTLLLLAGPITPRFDRAGVLAADGHCKPFDAAADGIVRGEGCGVVVLQAARPTPSVDGDRVLAVIRGSGGQLRRPLQRPGRAEPRGAAARLLRARLRDAGLDPPRGLRRGARHRHPARRPDRGGRPRRACWARGARPTGRC